MNAPFRKASSRRRKSATVDIEPALLERAKSAGLDPSAVLTERLKELLQLDAAEKWRRENADAIKARNERVARYGLFADRVRKW
jgi:antitoxin CcdA